jgi:hypothetical protein
LLLGTCTRILALLNLDLERDDLCPTVSYRNTTTADTLGVVRNHSSTTSHRSSQRLLEMKFTWLAIVVLTFTAIYAQNVPLCIKDCISAQCPNPAENVTCFCDPANGPPLLDCITANCSNRQAAATTSLQNLCSKFLQIDMN